MKRFTRWINDDKYEAPGEDPFRRFSFLKLLQRYPIFLLAFGPPIFRFESVDATKGILDFWSILQVSLLFAVAIRAIWRLAAAQSILIPKQIRSILILAFFLGALYLASAEYSPSRIVSAAYSILYFLSLICVVEFIVDVYRNPPNWLQFMF